MTLHTVAFILLKFSYQLTSVDKCEIFMLQSFVSSGRQATKQVILPVHPSKHIRRCGKIC